MEAFQVPLSNASGTSGPRFAADEADSLAFRNLNCTLPPEGVNPPEALTTASRLTVPPTATVVGETVIVVVEVAGLISTLMSAEVAPFRSEVPVVNTACTLS